MFDITHVIRSLRMSEGGIQLTYQDFYCRQVSILLSRLQQIHNSLARSVVKVPKSCHITPILRSLHWLRITESIIHK